MKAIDRLQRKLDAIEKTWPMTGSYERVDPYVIPYLQAGSYYQLVIFHVESKLWFDNTNSDYILNYIVSNTLIQEGDVAFDLGCNAGAITVILGHLVGPGGQVHSFDPYPWNAAATAANAELNYLANVTAYPLGLSNRDYSIKVSPNDSRIYEGSVGADAQTLEIQSIGRFMHLRPKFLKIDIEGAEFDLFHNQDASVFGSVENFALEFHPFWLRPRGIDPKLALANIEKAGFSLHYYTGANPPYDVSSYSDDHHMFWGKRRPS